jgi:radical SAM superfamily enzyme YgiQ (UPF0313 family)
VIEVEKVFRAVLVNPPALARAEMHDLPDYPHAGLAYLAGSLRDAGTSVRVVDAKLERLSVEETLERVFRQDVDLVGVTCMTHEVDSAVRLAQGIRAGHNRPHIVVGGVHVTALPAETLEAYPEFDFAVFGEGEKTIVELAAALRHGGGFEDIPGLAWRAGVLTRVNEVRPWNTDLDALVSPAWDLFPEAREYHIVTARGCPYPCIFCMSPYGKKVRERSPENVIAEMKSVARRYRPRHYKVNDESFGFNADRAAELLELMIANEEVRLIPKTASLRADCVTEDLMRRMKKAGFVYVDFGLESGDAEVLKRTRKGITLDDSKRAVGLARAAGLRVGGNFIIGHPGETVETARKTIRFAVELNCDFNAFGIMTPYPGTQVYELAKNNECGYRMTSCDWRDFNKQLGGALELDQFPRFKLELYQLKGYVSVFLLNFRFLAFAAFIWKFRRAAVPFTRNIFHHMFLARRGAR